MSKVYGLFEWKGICAGFFFIVSLYSVFVGDPVIKRGGFFMSLTGLVPPQFAPVPVPSQDLDFQRQVSWSFCAQ
jgi:hypothetical protein